MAKQITREEINSMTDTGAKQEGALLYYEGINQNVCLRIVEERPVKSIFEDFRVSEYEIGGKGIESIVWPDRKAETPTFKTCCNYECDKCRTTPSVCLIPLKPWRRLCDKFGIEHLYAQFCIDDSALVSLADSQQMSLENDRINDIEDMIIDDLNNLDNYWIDGVQGQQLKFKSYNEAIYSVVMEFVSKTNRYNKPQKKWRSNASDIYIIATPQIYKEIAGEDRDKFRTWFDNCVTPFKCDELHYISLNGLKTSDMIIIERKKIKWGDQFNRLKMRELEDCLETVFYKHYKIVAGLDCNINGVSIIIDKNANPDAAALKEKISSLDNNVEVADDKQPTAEAEIKKLVDALNDSGSKLKLKYDFSNFNAPTDSDGSIQAKITITNENDEELDNITKNFVLKKK